MTNQLNVNTEIDELKVPSAIVFLLVVDLIFLIFAFTLLITALVLQTGEYSFTVWGLLKNSPVAILNLMSLIGIARMRRWGADVQLGLCFYQVLNMIAHQQVLFFQTILLILHFVILIRYRGEMHPYSGARAKELYTK